MDFSTLLEQNGGNPLASVISAPKDANLLRSFEIAGLPANIAQSFSQVKSTQLGAVIRQGQSI